METGLFDGSPVNDYEFETDKAIATHSGRTPLPDEMPPALDLRHLPKDVLKTSTVESLIAQNEDVMARLKVALRRLSTIELENQRLARMAQESLHKLNTAEDAKLVFQEKDQVWKERYQEAQTRAEVSGEKLRILEEKMRLADHELEHHRQYHDRIRTQVKPHLVELKEYARSLEAKVADLEREAFQRESQMRDTREQMLEVTKNSKFQVEIVERRLIETIESYEATTGRQKQELDVLKERLEELEAKATRLHRAESRADELENELVETRRLRDEVIERLGTEQKRHMARAEEITGENMRLKLENGDLREKAMSDYKRLQDFEKQVLDQQSQLESLRFMYKSKSDESDRLKLAASALEQLNVDLSTRIQSMRGPQPHEAETVG